MSNIAEDKGADRILARLGLIGQLVTEQGRVFERETAPAWRQEAARSLRMLRKKDGSQSRLGTALLRVRGIDPRLRWSSAPPWGGRMSMSPWVNAATKGAFQLSSQARERIYRRWPNALGVWRDNP